MSNRVFHALKNRGLVSLGGEAVGEFLGDLITLSIADLPHDEVRAAALLTPQGRILFDLMVSRDNGGFLLETDLNRCGELIKKLTLYRMRRAINIAADSRPVFAVEGFIANEGGLRDARFADAVGRIYADAPQPPIADADAYKRRRWLAGIPEGADELPPERALPLEARLDLNHGISFDKGCYIGQEVTARSRHRGLIKRSYVPVKIDGHITTPQPITADGKDAGTVFGAVTDAVTDAGTDGGAMLGIASIRLDRLAPFENPPSENIQIAEHLYADGIPLTPFLPERLRPLPKAPASKKSTLE